jgi:hypothetical protein
MSAEVGLPTPQNPDTFTDVGIANSLGNQKSGNRATGGEVRPYTENARTEKRFRKRLAARKIQPVA